MNVLPELKSGQVLKDSHGRLRRVTRIRSSKSRQEFDEPLYRITYLNAMDTGLEVTSHTEYTLEDLARQGLELAD